MCLLLEKARKDYDTVINMRAINDELYLDICCYHIQQAIEKVLKCAIELKGIKYPFTHSISSLYKAYVDAGWPEMRDLRMMSGTLADWESSSRYKDSFVATLSQLDDAICIYNELETVVLQYLGISEQNSSPSKINF